MITVGAPELGGVRGIPSHPASPIAVDAESMMITKVIIIPQNDRRNTTAVMRRIAYISGMRVDRSWTDASKKAFDSITPPVM
jgi:hypothetical protein